MQLSVVAGNTQRLDGGALFGNAPKALWQRWVSPDEQNRVPLACRALLVQLDDGHNILLEAGIGAFFDPQMKERYGVQESGHQLLENLGKLGLTDADINVVILSHLHFDHAGGLLSVWQKDQTPRLLFPNAQFYVGERQWQRACSPHPRDQASYIPALNQQLQSSGRLHLIADDGQHSLPACFQFRFSDGHTPGLMLTQLETSQGPLLFCADLIPGTHWVHLPICMGYDRYPELLIEEKQQVLEALLAMNGRLFFTHDPLTACAWVKKDDRGRFTAVPADLQA